MELKMTRGQLVAFMQEHFPAMAGEFVIEAGAPMRLPVR